MADEVIRLRSTSDRLLERELFVCTVGELELLQAVGYPSFDTAFSGGPPKLVWDLEWSCGLTVSLQFDQLEQQLTGHLDRPEVEHLFRHLGIEPTNVWLLERELPQRFEAQCPPPDRGFELWQADVAGAEVNVAGGLTRGDADCWCNSLTAQHPEQRCWVKRAADVAPPRPLDLDATRDLEPPPPRGTDDDIRQHLIARLARPPRSGA